MAEKTQTTPKTATEEMSSSDAQGRFHATPKVRALSRGAGVLALIATFLILGLISLRFPRGAASTQKETTAPGYTVPAVGADQLETMSERLRRRTPAPRLPEPLPPIVLPPPPPPEPRPTLARQRSIFDVPMSPGRGSRSRALAEGGGSDEGLPPSFQLPQAERDRLEALARATQPGEPRQGFRTEGEVTSLKVNSESRGLHLRRGSFLPVVLTHPVNTDVPGLIRGQIARDVRDATGQHVLLPQGTLLTGQQRSTLSPGDARLLIDWRALHLADGRVIELAEPQGTAATDGSLGATGKVDRHFGSRFGTALLLGALGATLQLSQPQESATFGQAASERQIAAGEVGARLNDLAERTLEERLNRPPTIEIPAGARLQLLLLQDLVFPEPVAEADLSWRTRAGSSAPGDDANHTAAHRRHPSRSTRPGPGFP